MNFLLSLVQEIEHCSRHTILGTHNRDVMAQVVYILYNTVRKLRTLYYDEVLSKHWDG
jgi:hypothetical protein